MAEISNYLILQLYYKCHLWGKCFGNSLFRGYYRIIYFPAVLKKGLSDIKWMKNMSVELQDNSLLHKEINISENVKNLNIQVNSSMKNYTSHIPLEQTEEDMIDIWEVWKNHLFLISFPSLFNYLTTTN